MGREMARQSPGDGKAEVLIGLVGRVRKILIVWPWLRRVSRNRGEGG